MYRVEWLTIAEKELTEMWLQADSATRRILTAASHATDQRLSQDPLAESESRVGITRITFIEPLAVTYQIESDGQTVTVLHIRKYDTQ